MKVFFIILFSLSCCFASAQSTTNQKTLQVAFDFFYQGRYQNTLLELEKVEKKLLVNVDSNKELLGVIYYWRGICFNRVQNFNEAIVSFEKSLGLDYVPADIHYEYGQALYAEDKLSEARIQFRESLRRKFKRGISLYYIGQISKEMGEVKKAFTFFRSINKLSSEESIEVKQASEMQIGELYLEQTNSSNVLNSIEEYVIPQYRKAIELDPQSELAGLINEKISNLERKYDLVLLQLSNGRPILNPPYLLRLSQEAGMDSNVLFSPSGTFISKSKQSSAYSKTDVLGRYTFYYRDFLSITPEFHSNFTHYFNRVPEIYRNDNYLIAPAVRASYEHELWNRPASLLFDYDYSESRRDVNAKKEFDLSYRSHALMLGEKFNFFNFGETLFKIKYRVLEGHTSGSDANLASLVFEQLKNVSNHTLYFHFSFDRMRVDDNRFDFNALTFRTDFFIKEFKNGLTPTVGLGITSVDPVRAKDERGKELLLNPSLRLSKRFDKNWRGNLKYDFEKYNSKDKDNFNYTKSVYALELEYLF